MKNATCGDGAPLYMLRPIEAQHRQMGVWVMCRVGAYGAPWLTGVERWVPQVQRLPLELCRRPQSNLQEGKQ